MDFLSLTKEIYLILQFFHPKHFGVQKKQLKNVDQFKKSLSCYKTTSNKHIKTILNFRKLKFENPIV